MYRRSRSAPNNSTRGSVKSQRKVNNANAPKKGGNSKPQKENAGNQRNLIGVSGTSLSNRFSTLQKQALSEHPVPQKKGPVVNVKKALPRGKKQVVPQKQAVQQQKQQQAMKKVVESNRTKRQQAVNSRRQGLAQTAAASASKANSKKAKQQKQKSGKAQTGNKSNSKNAKEKKAPVTNDDLDVEMDAYWHEAGKGPDPKAAQLDRQMEQYWAGKPKQEAESTAA